MRFAVLADIHGNLPALEAVLADARSLGVDRWACLGDVVGYGPDPVACLEHLEALDAVCVQGNHEAALLGLDTGPFNELAEAAVEYSRRVLGGRQWEQVRAFREQERPDDRILLVHGSLFDRDEYLFLGSQMRAAWSAQESWLVFGGHTHQQLYYDGQEVLAGDVDVTLDLAAKYLVNPGSVGQPRDGDPRAGWAWVDLDAGQMRLRRVEYDVESAVERYKDTNLPDRLAERLRVGR